MPGKLPKENITRREHPALKSLLWITVNFTEETYHALSHIKGPKCANIAFCEKLLCDKTFCMFEPNGYGILKVKDYGEEDMAGLK